MLDWKDTTERYIAFLDIMGFTNYVYRNSHNVVKKRMLLIQAVIDKTEAEIHSSSKEFDGIENILKTVIFSDSILIISKDGTKASLDYLLFACQLLLSESFKKEIPMKGAISYGNITADFDKSLFFGKALIDAYSLQEQLFIYGVALDEKAEKKVSSIKDYMKAYCIRTKVATKSGAITHLIVNWAKWADKMKNDNDSNSKVGISIMERFYNDMSGHPRKYIDNTIECFPKAST